MPLPLQFQQSLESLSKFYYNKYPKTDKDFHIFKEHAEINYNKSYINQEKIVSIIDTVTAAYKPYIDTYVKEFKYDIPAIILPQNSFGSVTDIAVRGLTRKQIKKLNHSTDNKNDPLSDDYAYNLLPSLQKYVPRGLCICEIYSNKEELFYDICIFGTKKFTGATKQDDDDNIDTKGKKYEIQSLDLKEKIVVMKKINGEALHVSGRYIQNIFYYFVGSKKNHIMIRDEKDIELYTLQNHVHAKTFARIFMKFLHSLSLDKREILQNLLHYTKCTMGCEILQPSYQHIVHISGEDNIIVFFAFTSPFNNDDTLTAFPPHIACKVMEALDFHTAPYNIKKITNNVQAEIINETRLDENTEGNVMYYLNKSNETICLLKVKSLWYIFLRALREKFAFYVAQKKNLTNKEIKTKINKRFDEIYKDFAVGDDNILQKYKTIANSFIDWFDETRLSQTECVKSQFPVLYNKFLERTWSL